MPQVNDFSWLNNSMLFIIMFFCLFLSLNFFFMTMKTVKFNFVKNFYTYMI